VRRVRLIRRLAGPVFILAGALHFVIPKTYRQIVPPYVPSPTAMVAVSGAAEIVGGVGLIAKAPARRLAGWWLVATLIAVFPANVHMALHAEDYPKVPGGAPALWARLPFQGVFIAWVLSASRR
jgi:uncharacterized membrane protein